MACTRPRLALEKASPASRLPIIILARYSMFAGFSIAGIRFCESSGMAASALRSVTGELAFETYASMAWTSASRPVAAVIPAGMVAVNSGSMRETSGTTVLLMMAIFTLREESVMMANWETSAEVPAVVGIQI